MDIAIYARSGPRSEFRAAAPSKRDAPMSWISDRSQPFAAPPSPCIANRIVSYHHASTRIFRLLMPPRSIGPMIGPLEVLTARPSGHEGPTNLAPTIMSMGRPMRRRRLSVAMAAVMLSVSNTHAFAPSRQLGSHRAPRVPLPHARSLVVVAANRGASFRELGLDRTATPDDIKAAYRSVAGGRWFVG